MRPEVEKVAWAMPGATLRDSAISAFVVTSVEGIKKRATVVARFEFEGEPGGLAGGQFVPAFQFQGNFLVLDPDADVPAMG
jgi:hypothetical protein